MSLLHKANQSLTVRPTQGPRSALRKPSLICRAEGEVKQAESTPSPASSSGPSSSSSSSSSSGLKPMSGFEWAAPALAFLESEEVKPSDVSSKVVKSDLYQKYAKDFFEGPVGSKSTGWNTIPETINGRAAMLGFLAAALAEILGAGSVLNQFAAGPQLVVITIGLITAGTVIPIVKGTDGGYLRSLLDTYALPENVFTPKLELVHGRLAMLGLVSLIAIELVKGSALL